MSDDILHGIVSDWRKPTALATRPGSLSEALMMQRGILPDKAFLAPRIEDDPFYASFAAHADWLVAQKPGTVFVNSDYDTDGATTAAILGKMLTTIGWRVRCFLPCRMAHQYGVNMPVIEGNYGSSKFDLLITSDCGATAMKPLAEFCEKNRVPTLVIDHHKRENVPEKFPPLMREINQQACLELGLRENGYSAAVLSVLLAEHVAQRKPELAPLIPELRILGGVSAIADVISMRGIASRFCAQTLLANGAGPESNLGVRALIKSDKYYGGKLTSTDVGFSLVPVINAAGRLSSANKALALFTAKDQQTAGRLIEELRELNVTRRAMQEKIQIEALERFDPAAGVLIAYDKHWHPGVVGPAAGSISERLGIPVFIGGFNQDKNVFSFSARSTGAGDIDIHKLLKGAAEGLPLTFGGHAVALGMRIDAGDVDSVVPKLIERMGSPVSRRDRATRNFNIYLKAATVCHHNWEQVNRLEPFGTDSEVPVFCIPNVDVNLTPMSSSPGSAHGVAVSREDPKERFRVVVFRNRDIADRGHIRGSVIGQLMRDSFRGDAEIKMVISDIIPDVPETVQSSTPVQPPAR
jgi:single-stranded-DNA-specific exonuclease